MYHPWCAITWFRTAGRCYEKTCLVLDPDWYNLSFGFGEFEVVLEEKTEQMDCEMKRQMVISKRTASAKGKFLDTGEF